MKYEKERETIFDLEFIILEIYHSFVFWIISEFDCSIIDFDGNLNINDWCQLLITLLLKCWCLSNGKDAKHPILSTFFPTTNLFWCNENDMKDCRDDEHCNNGDKNCYDNNLRCSIFK